MDKLGGRGVRSWPQNRKGKKIKNQQQRCEGTTLQEDSTPSTRIQRRVHPITRLVTKLLPEHQSSCRARHSGAPPSETETTRPWEEARAAKIRCMPHPDRLHSPTMRFSHWPQEARGLVAERKAPQKVTHVLTEKTASHRSPDILTPSLKTAIWPRVNLSP